MDSYTPEALLALAGMDDTPPDPIIPPPPASLIASEEELAAARLTPRCIVRRHSYADVAQIVAPGGTGKTTLLIHEAVHIALGWPVWGLEVESPGWTLIVTAEDRRERILARLREMLAALNLDPAERAVAREGVRVWDVCGEPVKLVTAADGNVILTALADRIVTAYTCDPPAVVVFDPLVSFGASESMVNDNEQAIVLAARRIVKGLDCCVRVIHHTGKANANDAALHQYAGRGGSALADGTRMTTVLQTWSPDGLGNRQPPPGCHPGEEVSITIMSRAKLSYAPPNLPLIWIRREGYTYEHFTEQPAPAPEVRRAAQAEQVARCLEEELGQERRYTAHALEDAADRVSMTRKHIREALSELRVCGRLWDAPMPKELCQGGRKTYLAVRPYLAEDDGEVGLSATDLDPPTSPPATTSPPYRECTSGEVVPEGTTLDSRNLAAKGWRGSARLAKYTDSMVIPAPEDEEEELLI